MKSRYALFRIMGKDSKRYGEKFIIRFLSEHSVDGVLKKYFAGEEIEFIKEYEFPSIEMLKYRVYR